MATLSPEQALINTIDSLEEEITEIKGNITEAIEKYAAAKGVTVEGVKKGIKEYRAYVKDQGKYTITDLEAAKLLEALTK